MIKDKNRAVTHMHMSLCVKAISCLMLGAAGSLDISSTILMIYSLYSYSLKSIIDFDKNGDNANNSKNLKRAAYMPFMLLFALIYANYNELGPDS